MKRLTLLAAAMCGMLVLASKPARAADDYQQRQIGRAHV